MTYFETLQQSSLPDAAKITSAGSSGAGGSIPVTAGMRSRVVLIGLLGIVLLVLLIQWSDMVVGGTMMAGPFPPLGATIFWGVLVLFNGVAGRLLKRTLLTRQELLLILAIWIAANMVAGRGLLHPLLTSLVGTTYYARSGVVSRALPQYLPDWLAVTDKRAARDFFEGHGIAVPWKLWQRPLLTWSLFLLPFLTANICLCALFERVWVRHERLAFPLVALPLELLDNLNDSMDDFDEADPEETDAPISQKKISNIRNRGIGGRRLDRRALAFGLSFPLLLHGFGVAHAYVPGIPCVPFFNDLSSLLIEPPWIVMRPLYLNIYPLLIGLTFLAPADMTFSVWFFLVLNKLEMLLTASSGWNDGATGSGGSSSLPFLEEQSAGAYLALGALLVWNARITLRGIIRTMLPFARTDTTTNYREYTPLAWGFALSVAGILVWCVQTGMPLWFAACFFGFYMIVALVLSRLMAEGGVSWILAPILPDKLIFSLLGTGVVSPLLLTRLPLHVQHLRDTRQMLAPAIMETGKLRDAAGISLRRFYGLLLASVVLALIVGVGSALTNFYHYGALSLTPNSDGLMMSASVVPLTGVNQASERLLHPVRPSAGSAGALALGAAITWLLSTLRTRFLWWPLHPLGYALTGTLQVGYANKMLFSIFMGWAFKTLTLRFGGVQGFRLLRGVALGLVLGDLLMGGILKILDALFGPSGYAIF